MSMNAICSIETCFKLKQVLTQITMDSIPHDLGQMC